MGGPFLFGVEGWKLVTGHFAERHGLIVIIALGESIVAIGVGAETARRRRHRRRRHRDGHRRGAVVAYFDVVALVAGRRLHGDAGAASRTARP